MAELAKGASPSKRNFGDVSQGLFSIFTGPQLPLLHPRTIGIFAENKMPTRVIRTVYTDTTLRVYQAYRPEIAIAALKAQRFVPPFKAGRMTWIKPSFNWMMYRCGFGEKPDQECVLGIDITRAGFEWALKEATLSHFDPCVHRSPEEWKDAMRSKCVRIQWDPERDWQQNAMEEIRSIQIGLSGEAVDRYISDWIVRIEDVTPLARRAAQALATGKRDSDMPDMAERPYPVDHRLRHILADITAP